MTGQGLYKQKFLNIQIEKNEVRIRSLLGQYKMKPNFVISHFRSPHPPTHSQRFTENKTQHIWNMYQHVFGCPYSRNNQFGISCD